MPQAAQPTLSFVHEYVHFVQQTASPMGISLIGELVNIAVLGALIMNGKVSSQGGTVESQTILPLLKNLRSGAVASVPELQQRIVDLQRDATLMLLPVQLSYPGARGVWEVDHVPLTYSQGTEDFYGYVTPSGRFRPFTPGMLAEAMARRLDRAMAHTMGWTFDWPDSDDEREFYNGLTTILEQPRYSSNITDGNRHRITIIVAHLGLACRRSDIAVKEMLDALARTQLGLLPEAVGGELSELLKRRGLLRADVFNELMAEIMHDKARQVMTRVEFYGLYEQLKKIHVAANSVLSNAAEFAVDEPSWEVACGWFRNYSVPRVVAIDGEVGSVAGETVSPAAAALLCEAQRVVFG